MLINLYKTLKKTNYLQNIEYYKFIKIYKNL